MNFGFLASKPEYALFSDACIEAERTFTTVTYNFLRTLTAG